MLYSDELFDESATQAVDDESGSPLDDESTIAALSGSGTLSGSPYFTSSAVLAGAGTLSGSGVFTLQPSAALSGIGTLGASPYFTSSPALSGAGTLGGAFASHDVLDESGSDLSDEFGATVEDEGYTPVPYPFPSLLKTSGYSLVDANGYALPTMRGINIIPKGIGQGTNPALSDIQRIYSKGMQYIRVELDWDNLQPSSGTAGIDTSYIASIDNLVSWATSTGLYVWFTFICNTMPSWAQQTAPTGSLQNYVANGQTITQYLAYRYGNPASPQYSVAVIGMDMNEPIVDYTNTTDWVTHHASQQLQMVTWMRASGYAMGWVAGLGCGPSDGTAVYPNAPGSGQTSQTFTGAPIPWTTNYVLDVHDPVKVPTTDTSTANYPDTDGRGVLGGFASSIVQIGNTTYPGYPPTISGVSHSDMVAMQKAWWANYEAYAQAAGVPIFLTEANWDPVVNQATAGADPAAVAYLADKLPLWFGTVTPTPAMASIWEYHKDQSTDDFAMYPVLDPSAVGASGTGWTIYADTFYSYQSGSTPGAGALSGTGSLAAAPAFAATEALSGTGSLAAAPAFAATEALSGTGSLSEIIGLAAAMTGLGTLSGSPAFAAAAVMSGTGLLSAVTRFASSPALSGSGTLSAAPVFAAPANLSGLGTLGTVPAFSGSAALSGLGTLSGALTIGTSAVLSGLGTLSGAYTGVTTATLTGLGALTASPVLPALSSLTGMGTLAGGAQLAGGAAMSGLGSLSAGARMQAAAAMSGTGILAATPALTALVTISGSGTMGGPSQITVTVAMSGLGSLTAAWQLAYQALAALAGSGTIGAAPIIIVPGNTGTVPWLAFPAPPRWLAAVCPPRWTAAPAPPRWEIVMAVFAPISALSLEEVNITWTSDLDGTTIDPTTLTVQFAVPVSSGILASPAQPVTWFTAAWLAGGIGKGFIAQGLVGPGGAVTLTSGQRYDVWGKILGSPEQPVKFAGQLPVY